jgi:EmrB/QacA subfamily drug resistance transporter
MTSAKPYVHTSRFYKWGGLIILGLAVSVIIIDTTLLNVSLKPIIIDLHTNLENLQWVITIYSLILGGFTISGGRLGDLFGRKKMFILGAVLFAFGALTASMSTSVKEMIIGESIIEGIGAALMLPATASLLISNYRGRDRAIAFGVWGGLAAASTAIGPVLGGWLTTHYSWRWGFRINIVVVLVLLLGTFLIKEGKRQSGKLSLDLIGIIISSVGLLAIVFAFLETSTYGWFVAKAPLTIYGYSLDLGRLSVTPLLLLFGLIVLGIFVWWEYQIDKNGKTPLVSLELFKNKQFVVGTLAVAILFLAQSGIIFAMPVFLQAVSNLDSLQTGLALLPMSAALLVFAPLSAAISKYISPKRIVQFGMVLAIAGFGVLRHTLHADSTIMNIAPGFMLFGAGMGFIMAQVSNLTLSAVSEEESGEAAGVNNTIRQVGSTLGSAIIGSILISSLAGNVMSGVQSSQIIPVEIKASVSQALRSQTADIEFGGGAKLAGPVEKPIQQELTKIIDQSTVTANRRSLAFGMAFLCLGLLVSLFLTDGKDEEYNKIV